MGQAPHTRPQLPCRKKAAGLGAGNQPPGQKHVSICLPVHPSPCFSEPHTPSKSPNPQHLSRCSQAPNCCPPCSCCCCGCCRRRHIVLLMLLLLLPQPPWVLCCCLCCWTTAASPLQAAGESSAVPPANHAAVCGFPSCQPAPVLLLLQPAAQACGIKVEGEDKRGDGRMRDQGRGCRAQALCYVKTPCQPCTVLAAANCLQTWPPYSVSLPSHAVITAQASTPADQQLLSVGPSFLPSFLPSYPPA